MGKKLRNVHDEERGGCMAICSEWRMILFQVLTKKFEKGDTLKFQKFYVNYHKFHALSSTRLSLLG
jgi:hypothetical protein